MSIFQRIFSSSNQRYLNKINKIVQLANELEATYKELNDNNFLSLKSLIIKDYSENNDLLTAHAFAAVREAGVRTIGLRHFDSQFLGGIALAQGKISEMKTGEGKTLVATLPVYLNALSGSGVHLVTVNDYLAKRDSAWMAPIFEFHGISVDCIDYHKPNSEARKNAYKADITYGTNNEFGFDYLRDNMAHSMDDLVQRTHNYAIVDEVDSVLVDDARTPLIISGPVADGDRHEFDALKPKISTLVSQQRQHLTTVLAQAKKLISEGDAKEGGFLLLRVYRGLPKNKALIKFLSQEGIRQLLQKTEGFYMQDNNREMPKVDADLLFVIDEKNNQIELTDKGVEQLSKDGDDADFFVLPDLGSAILSIEQQEKSPEEEAKEKEAGFDGANFGSPSKLRARVVNYVVRRLDNTIRIMCALFIISTSAIHQLLFSTPIVAYKKERINSSHKTHTHLSLS